MTMAQSLLHYQQLCLRYENTSLEGFFMREIAGRIVSMAAACLLHAEAVSRATKICFWVIQEIFSHLDDPWLTIPWLEREKELLKKTYSDSLCSFAETVYPPKHVMIEEPLLVTDTTTPEPVSELSAPPPLIVIEAPHEAVTPEPTASSLRPRTGARAPSPENDIVVITPRDPDAQQRFDSRGSTPIDAVIVPDLVHPGQLLLREALTPRESMLLPLQPPPRVPTQPIDVVKTISSIIFPSILQPKVARFPEPVRRLEAPPRISTAPIDVVKDIAPIQFPSIRKKAEEWDRMESPIPAEITQSDSSKTLVPPLDLPPPPPSYTTLHTANGDDWDNLSSARTESPPQELPAGPLNTERSSTTTGDDLTGRIAAGPFKPVITTPQSPPTSYRSNA